MVLGNRMFTVCFFPATKSTLTPSLSTNWMAKVRIKSVSYTHLDVYKRQVLLAVAVLQFSFQGDGNDFHVLVRMDTETFARGYAVVVQYTQGAEVHAAGIVRCV